jgi:hypothetical protein
LSIVSVDQFVNSQRFAGKITSVRVQKMGVTSMLKAKVAEATALGGTALVDSPELVDGPDGVCRPTPFSVFCDQPRNADGSWTRCVRRNPSYPGYYLHAVTTCSTLRSGDPVPTGTAPDYIGS